MTKLQYLALRTVFSAEIARREDRDLARIIKTLVDDPIEQRIRERRAQEQDARPLPTMPQSIQAVATLPTTPPPRNASPVPPH